MSRHLELLSRLRDLSAARDTARRLANRYEGARDQTETFFRFTYGSMSICETLGQTAELIWSTTPDDEYPAGSSRNGRSDIACNRTDNSVSLQRPGTGAIPGRLCTLKDYTVVELGNPQRVEALKRQMAVRSVIARRRETFSHFNVRIHLDLVSGRGAFLQLETGLCHQFDARTAGAQLVALATEFGIHEADVLPSYLELVTPATVERRERSFSKNLRVAASAMPANGSF